MDFNKDLAKDFYKTMWKIRLFEEAVEKLFLDGEIPGFVHLYIGEEAIATGVCANLKNTDYIESTHRGHGHTLAKGADVNRAMAEIFDKSTGFCKGKGGSMHIADFSVGMLGANGVVGGGFNLAVGATMAIEYQKRQDVSVDKKYDEILGVHIYGPRATELINEAALAIRLESTIDELITTIHAYPTVAESMKEAALAVKNIAIHAVNN